MRGGLVCELCKSYQLQIIYIRQTLKFEVQNLNESKKRKQAFSRIGLRCEICGSVFLDSIIFKQWREKQKEQREYRRSIPRGTPKVKQLIPFRIDYNGILKRYSD